ncbi:MAG: permease-like cell division protein FtsX [Bacteroidaceae bacterium]|nr:permease-like cell division protein FtsX [Bacteroidaceae bacterium]
MSKKGFNMQTLSVYMSTTLVLVLLGMMGILLVVADSLSGQIRKNITVSVIMDADMDETDIKRYQSRLDKRIYTSQSKYISKEAILEEQKVELGADPTEFLGYNPYEPSIELSMQPEYANNDSLAKIEKQLLKDKGVTEVIYQKDIIGAINSNINKIGIALFVLMILLSVISWSLIGNMVRMSIYSKRFLLHTMKLVGATWGFIRRPFIVKNLWIGLISGVLANITLGALIYFITVQEPAMSTLLSIVGLATVAIGVFLFGVTITVLCAFLSVNRFLRMRGNDLYFI